MKYEIINNMKNPTAYGARKLNTACPRAL
jgi:hypothetical protein